MCVGGVCTCAGLEDSRVLFILLILFIMELQFSLVFFFTAIVALLLAAVLHRKSNTPLSSSANKEIQLQPQAVPEAPSTSVSGETPEPVKESSLGTLLGTSKDSDSESVSAPETLPNSISEPVSLLDPFLASSTRPKVPELLPANQSVSKLPSSSESVFSNISLLEVAPQPEQASALEPVPQPLVAPKIVAQLETVAHTNCIPEQVSERAPDPAQKQISEAQRDPYPKPFSEPELETVCVPLPGSDQVSVPQVVKEEEPVSELEPDFQSEFKPEEVLEVVAESVSGSVNTNDLVSRSPEENLEPVAEPETKFGTDPEIKEAATSQEKVCFSPGKKRNKLETLMSKEEMEEEQRVQQEQLAAILLLLRENQEVLEVTEGDMEEQLKLYSL
ncbi:protein TsetseEP-like isoform X2 [Nerophis ophidion]|uniref:protein TsetseEP-like isoform X2 n=1 Tax=Nerophis ophidion TaxID=159077 RepID=UPI002AE07BFC|nr:protein TsetseEP-like isoform X2 [Nerophis ophidion]